MCDIELLRTSFTFPNPFSIIFFLNCKCWNSSFCSANNSLVSFPHEVWVNQNIENRENDEQENNIIIIKKIFYPVRFWTRVTFM